MLWVARVSISKQPWEQTYAKISQVRSPCWCPSCFLDNITFSSRPLHSLSCSAWILFIDLSLFGFGLYPIHLIYYFTTQIPVNDSYLVVSSLLRIPITVDHQRINPEFRYGDLSEEDRWREKRWEFHRLAVPDNDKLTDETKRDGNFTSLQFSLSTSLSQEQLDDEFPSLLSSLVFFRLKGLRSAILG